MNELTIFNHKDIRYHWDEATQTWFFSVVDIVAALTQSASAKRYWSDLKRKLIREGSQLYEKIVQLKFKAADGKFYATDCLNTAEILRLIQSVPSPKAEPLKLWLAKVGYERMQEIGDPELSMARARENWQAQGRSDKWIQQRMTGQETRHKLTDYWATHGVQKGQEFAILTNLIHHEWAGVSVQQHKAQKGLQSQNLRDHMSEAELIFTALAELSTRQIAETEQADGLVKNADAAQKGGAIAKNARKALENQTGQSVVTGENFLPPAKSTKRLKE